MQISTSPTTPPGSSTANSTRRSPGTGRRPPARPSHPAVPRRLGQPVPGGDRRAARRRGHPRARLRHRRHRRTRRAPAAPTGRAVAAQQRALHLHARLPGAQGQPQEHPRLGRSDPPGRGRSSRPTRRPPAWPAGTTWPCGATPAPRAGRIRPRLGIPTAAAVAAAQAKAQEFVAAVYRNVPVLDRAARGATNTFIQRRIGDVLINWENEILLGGRELDEGRAGDRGPRGEHPRRAGGRLVDRNVDRKGTREVAQAYLEYLYSEVGQDLAGRYYYRPAVSPSGRRSIATSSPNRTVHHRRGLRRLGEANRSPLRRRRHLRPDLPDRE
jgi:hypothetical protein